MEGSGPTLPLTQSLSLEHVVTTLSGTLTEEHAWAILYQGITKLHEVSTESCYLLKGLGDLLLTGDGTVHQDSFLEENTTRGVRRPPMSSFSTGIAELGVIVFEALDWGVPQGMSRQLSGELEALIDMMVSADDQDQEDEGISIGEEEMFSSLCRKIAQSCRRHHSPLKSVDAEAYYRQVCQDLVEQVTDISSLMKKLNLKDWRDLDTEEDSKKLRATFSEVMQELLSGVKLRKVESPPQNQLSLSTHDVLMIHIKSRKIILKPPVLPAEAKRTERDLIMDFIKSKPRLKPVLERKLPRSPQQEESQVERLLNDIRGGKARQSLRRARPRLHTTSLIQSLEQLAVSGPGKKKIIEPEPDFQSLVCNFEVESPNTSGDEDSVFAESGKEEKLLEAAHDDQDYQEEDPGEAETREPLTEKKSLTLDELSSIRSKLARAQLELKDLSDEARLALEAGRVCFSCEKTRFSWFSWALNCKICQRAVCKGCSVKLRLPTSTWSEVKVSSLSTQLGMTEVEPSVTRPDNPFIRTGNVSRMSLMARPGKTVEASKLCRSNTLSRSEARAAGERAVSGANTNICLQCKTELASIIWGKTSPRTPSKKPKSIFDSKSMTITKRRLSRHL